MAVKAQGSTSPETELLQKLLTVQLHTLGVNQDAIGKIVGRRKAWVNALLRAIPKRSKSSQ